MFRPPDPYHMAMALEGIINTFLFGATKDPPQFRKNNNLSIAEEIFFGELRTHFHKVQTGIYNVNAVKFREVALCAHLPNS